LVQLQEQAKDELLTVIVLLDWLQEVVRIVVDLLLLELNLKKVLKWLAILVNPLI
jgi:hypothetical protein